MPRRWWFSARRGRHIDGRERNGDDWVSMPRIEQRRISSFANVCLSVYIAHVLDGGLEPGYRDMVLAPFKTEKEI